MKYFKIQHISLISIGQWKLHSLIPEVFNNKEKRPKLSFLKRDANLVLPFLTLGYGKKNIRERGGEREG